MWTESKYPGFGRGARYADRRDVGMPLLKVCTTAHLHSELADLSPRRVVALGELAYERLSRVVPEEEWQNAARISQT
jgi:hypothetical protein